MQTSARSLRVFAVLRVFLPLMAVQIVFFAVGAVVMQRILINLLADRHRQIAASAAVGISNAVEGYAHILEALAANPELLNASAERRLEALKETADALVVFNAGVAVFDENGFERTFFSAASGYSAMPVSPQSIASSVWERRAPVFSDLIQGASGENYILIGVPIRAGGDAVRGVLVGVLRAETAAFSLPIRQLAVGRDGFAYLTDASGRVIFHPNAAQIGADYSQAPFYQYVMADRSTGVMWTAPGGQRLFGADAAVAATGWALIVQESWGSALAPAQPYVWVAVFAGVVGVLFIVLIAWQGVRRINLPVQQLREQTRRLARGEPLGKFRPTRIHEIDDLEAAFDDMARQITAYRAGLHRYIEALTQSQENERRRIARELHDETVQNLLAVLRQLELYELSENDPVRQERIKAMQTVMAETLHGIRRVIADLRPLMLEDLGLVPALKALVRALREGPQAVPHVQLDFSGEPAGLPAEHELAIYRIVQEALSNVRKHANASGVRVQVAFHSERVIVEIEDNGTGFQVPVSLTSFTQTGSFGLMGIQERVWALGGKFTIHSVLNDGTTLCVEVPTHE